MAVEDGKILDLLSRILFSRLGLRNYPRLLEVEHDRNTVFVVPTHQSVMCIRTIRCKVWGLGLLGNFGLLNDGPHGQLVHAQGIGWFASWSASFGRCTLVVLWEDDP
jgi:hypothetical protein